MNKSAEGSVYKNRQTSIPRPPFYGTRIVPRISVEHVYNYINPVVLFRVQWGYRRQPDMTQHEYDRYIEREVVPVYEHYKLLCLRNSLIQPQVVYGYFYAQSDGDNLVIYHNDGQTQWVQFSFPRQTHTPERRCITDYFASVNSGQLDLAVFQIVTIGSTLSEVARSCAEKGDEAEYRHLNGLAVEMTEALAEYAHRQLRLELDIADEDSPYVLDMFHGSYRGARFAFGDATGPNTADLAELFALLEPTDIGVALTQNFRLTPEHTSASLIVHHPEARIFNVR